MTVVHDLDYATPLGLQKKWHVASGFVCVLPTDSLKNKIDRFRDVGILIHTLKERTSERYDKERQT